MVVASLVSANRGDSRCAVVGVLNLSKVSGVVCGVRGKLVLLAAVVVLSYVDQTCVGVVCVVTCGVGGPRSMCFVMLVLVSAVMIRVSSVTSVVFMLCVRGVIFVENSVVGCSNAVCNF